MRIPLAISRLAAVALALVAAAPAQAQDLYPSRPVKIVVPAPTGGITDLLARFASDYLGRVTNQRFVVENKTGGNGNPALDSVAKSAPDGYTLLMVNMSNIAIVPQITKDVTYDPLRDFAPIAPVGDGSSVLAVHKDLPAKTLKEFIDYAKANPGKLNYGSAGIGTTPHLAGDLFARKTGIQMVHIPYRGAGPAAVDLGTGQVQAAFIGLGSLRAQYNNGQIRILAVARTNRLEALPDVPTFAEAGLPGYEPINWFGLVAPAATPKPVVALLNKHVGAMVDEPDVKKRLRDGGIEPMKESPEAFAARLNGDHKMWGDLVRAAKITVD
jgi:tripartite-type tricarboxylate transporter receptor subunit TctC